MIPIFEQGDGKGIGHSVDSFQDRFDSICHDHLRTQRAMSFAFIFYDFRDKALRKILKDQGVFAKIDRLSGTKLSVFYLHSSQKKTIEAFNTYFLPKLGINEEITLPCVVFFKINGGNIEDVAIAQLDSTDLIHGFKELYDKIENYIADEKTEKTSRLVKWIKSGSKIISIEVFRAGLKSILSGMF